MSQSYKLTPIRNTAQQALGSGAMDEEYVLTKDGKFHWLGIAFSGAVSQDVAVIFNSVDGAAYDIELDASTLSSATDYVFRPNTPIIMKKGDAVQVTCTNSGTPAITASLTMFLEEEPTWKP